MRINRRKALSVLTVGGAASRALLAQAPAISSRTPDQELEIARAGRLVDAQRIAMVKLPHDVEPAFRFRA